MTDAAPTHHLPDAILQAYAAGTLCEAFSLVAACHISLCDSCRGGLGAQEALGGEILADQPEAELASGAFEALMARIAAADAAQPPKTDPAVRGGVFPTPLQDYAGQAPDQVKWKPIGGGVRQAVLDVEGPETARLLFIPAGKAVPEHSHEGLELTLVLQGAFADKIARFARGDLEIGDSDLDHQPIAETGEDCICLAATDARLRFKGLIPKLVQPFVGI